MIIAKEIKNVARREEVTRENILKAAVEVFAELGFHGATTREIASRAKVNVASLHYHFHDKKGLYAAVFDHFVDVMLASNPLPVFPDRVAPRKKLEIFIESMVRRFLHRERSHPIFKIILREFNDPTTALDQVVNRLTRPIFFMLISIVREILGDKFAEMEIRLCCSSIVGQCFFHRFAWPIIDRISPGIEWDEPFIKRLAAHISGFSLAALDSLSRSRKQTSRTRKGAQ
jgi:TetR/AcrR family transcriptional regulator, regulator of cefoperazone and chloramphenicol sensitivity